jgi:hypothetical protein
LIDGVGLGLITNKHGAYQGGYLPYTAIRAQVYTFIVIQRFFDGRDQPTEGCIGATACIDDHIRPEDDDTIFGTTSAGLAAKTRLGAKLTQMRI